MDGPNPRVIMGIDPGMTTGVGAIRVPGKLVEEHYSSLRGFHSTNPQEVLDYVEAMAERYTIVAVVVEDFVGSGPRDIYAIHTLKVLGLFEGWCRRAGFNVWVRPPQTRKAFVSDSWNALGRSTSKHVVDATAHAIALEYDVRTGRINLP